ncbi:MAG: tRNA lysidine(34) synthetase TilS [Deinococcales bacterium]
MSRDVQRDEAGLAHGVAQRLRALAPEAGTVLLGLSGGPDSVAALHLLLDAGVTVVAAHFDHRLRPASSADASFVRSLCERVDVPLLIESADVAAVARERGWNLEDAARRLRYGFLHRAAAHAGAEAVVVAHTLDDQAETVLLQLLRGTAFAAGMPPRRGAVVRPLLDVPRSRLRAYLDDAGLAYRHDESNDDVGRTRAWLRSEVLPLLEGRFPGVAGRLARTALVQRDAEGALEEVARVRFGDGAVRREALLRAPPGLQRAALTRLLEAAGAPVSLERLETVRSALARETPWRVDVGSGRVLRVAYGRVELARPSARGAAVRVRSAADLPAGVDPRVVDTHPDLELRSRRPGDRMRLPGGSRRVADLLVDRKVPREARDGLRLLASGRDVLWIDGVAAAPGVMLEEAPVDPDEGPMRRALTLAREAAEAGELPVGAVVTLDGRVVGEAANRTEADRDPTAHAEVLALRAAAAAVGDWRLAGATLTVTLEPCPMCFGAVQQTQLRRVVYGADNVREGALGGVVDLRAGAFKRRQEVRGGVLAGESAALLRVFFEARRR